MTDWEKLLLQNKAWVQEQLDQDKDFFQDLAKAQNPQFLWIGCSDSRVPSNQVTGTSPGDMFVHRNISNLVVNTDLNMLSVLEYAIDYLHVKHVIVCGHYGCGGVRAAMTRQSFGLINKWLLHIKDVYRFHKTELDAIEDPQERENRLIELNVEEQVLNLTKTSIVQRAWKRHNRPTLHGWVYGLNNGVLKDLIKIDPNEQRVDDIYTFETLRDED